MAASREWHYSTKLPTCVENSVTTVSIATCTRLTFLNHIPCDARRMARSTQLPSVAAKAVWGTLWAGACRISGRTGTVTGERRWVEMLLFSSRGGLKAGLVQVSTDKDCCKAARGAIALVVPLLAAEPLDPGNLATLILLDQSAGSKDALIESVDSENVKVEVCVIVQLPRIDAPVELVSER